MADQPRGAVVEQLSYALGGCGGVGRGARDREAAREAGLRTVSGRGLSSTNTHGLDLALCGWAAAARMEQPDRCEPQMSTPHVGTVNMPPQLRVYSPLTPRTIDAQFPATQKMFA